jgi:PAS domain S-box-containing protein
VVIARDVSQRVDAEHRLRESEERYRQLVESAPVGILVIQDQKIVFCNGAGAELCGTTDIGELIGTNILDLVEAADAGAVAERLARAVTRMPTADTMEARVHGLDGRTRDVVGTGRVISYRGAPALQDVVRDVTDLRAAEREQTRLELQLQETQKLESLGILAGGIAHDFNNLLAVILGNVRFARKLGAGQGDLDEALAETVEAAESAARLTRQLLAYAGRRSPDVRPVNLSQLVEENTALLGSAVPRRVALAFELAPDIPAVRADAVQLEQITMNLVINAAEAIGDRTGTIRVATGCAEVSRPELSDWIGGGDLDPGVYAYLEVKDSGRGMEAATREHIFEPFFTTKAQGHGLGLSAVLGLVRGHGGAISVETAPELGTAIRIYLPASDEAAERGIEPARKAEASAWNAAILVVDDEGDRDRPLIRLLRECGARLVETSGGADAIQWLRLHGEEIDAALIDLDARTPPGVDVALELRAQRPDLPLLLIGTGDDAALARRLANDAPTAFVSKPYRDETLLEQLRVLLGKDLVGLA